MITKTESNMVIKEGELTDLMCVYVHVAVVFNNTGFGKLIILPALYLALQTGASFCIFPNLLQGMGIDLENNTYHTFKFIS